MLGNSSASATHSPLRRSAGAAAPTGSKPSYTTADIAAFYDDIRKGKFKGREDERAKIERDIFAAQAEGRIT